MLQLIQYILRSFKPKLLYQVAAFVFLANHLKRLYDLCWGVEKTWSSLSAHHRSGIGRIKHISICSAWSLEIQVVNPLLSVKRLVHLIFCTVSVVCLFLLHHLSNKHRIFELYNDTLRWLNWICILAVIFAASHIFSISFITCAAVGAKTRSNRTSDH